MSKCQIIIRIALYLVIVLCAKSALAQSEDLLLPLRQPRRLAAEALRSELRSNLARLNLRFLTSLKSSSRASFNLNLFADANFKARIISSERPYRDSEAWSGLIEGGAGTFTLVKHKKQFRVNVRLSSGAIYHIRPSGRLLYVVSQIEQSRIKECGVGLGPDRGHRLTTLPRVAPVSERRAMSDDPSKITVLVVYTPAARDRAASQAGHPPGTTADIEALIDTCVAETNEAYRLSEINPRLHLTYRGLQPYAGDKGQGNSVYTVLPLFRGKADGTMDDVHTVRNRVGVKADVCVLLFVASDAGGLARMMNQHTFNTGFESEAFAVVDLDSASANLNFGHEISHIQGNCHNRRDCTDAEGNLDQGVFPYSYGYRYRTGGTLFHTITAYRPGALTLHFSNPDVLDNGVPTGIPESQAEPCNEAKTINSTAAVVANFRN